MSRFSPLISLCVGVLAGPLLAQNPSVRLHPTIDSSHTEIWVSGLTPFEGFDLSLTFRSLSLRPIQDEVETLCFFLPRFERLFLFLLLCLFPISILKNVYGMKI